MKNRIKEIRLERGMSLGLLGEKTGISSAMLYRYETYEDIYRIPFDKVQKISNALGVSFSTLSGNSDVDERDIYYRINRRNSLVSDINNNYEKYFSSENDFLSTSYKVDIKKKKVNKIAERLMKINNDGLNKITDYIDYIESKNEHIDSSFSQDYNSYKKMYSEIVDEILRDIESSSNKENK